MKAIVLNGFGSVNNFSMENINLPEPKHHELLIAIKATAFNPIDYQMRLGRRESQHMHSPVLGRELAGIVLAAGKDTSGFKPGDEVIADSGSRGSNGSYATHMALNYRMVAHKPPSLPFETAAAIPSAGLTAWQTFNRMKATPQQSIFITGGAGAVGSFLIKLLKAHDIPKIFATAGNKASIAALQQIGLPEEQIIDYHQHNLVAVVLQCNQQQPYDWAVDIVGGSISETAAAVLGVNKNYADITFLGTPQTRELLFDKGANVLNIANYAYAANNQLEWYGDNLRQLAALITTGKITPPAIEVVGGFSADTVKHAHTLMESNQVNGRKLVMTMEG